MEVNDENADVDLVERVSALRVIEIMEADGVLTMRSWLE